MTVNQSNFICGKCNKRMITTVTPSESNIEAMYVCPKCGYYIVNKPIGKK